MSPTHVAASLPGRSTLRQAWSRRGSGGARTRRDAPVSHSPCEGHAAEHWHPLGSSMGHPPGSCWDLTKGLSKGEQEGGLPRPASALHHVPSFGRN